MAENMVIYAGVGKIGEMKSKAVKREAKRRGQSVSDYIWELLRWHGSDILQADLEAADKAKA